MGNGEKILLVEDEDSLAIGLQYNLEEEGYRVFLAKDGKMALDMFEERDYDLIILDIMLPYLDGFEVARRIREKSNMVPILILTAKSRIEDKIEGFQRGADDYLLKPFHLEELILRVKRILERKKWYRNYDGLKSIEFGGNKVNFETLMVKGINGEFRLTSQEADFLKFLYENKGRVVSRKEILSEVWGMDSNIETRTIDNFIVRFRKYFEENPKDPVYFRSVRGKGYIFDID